jgi:hypothetical protein
VRGHRDEVVVFMNALKSRESGSVLFGAIIRGLAVIVVANLFFFAAMLVTQPRREVIIPRIRAAFETGELGNSDFLWFRTRRGWFQYNDCNVLQMLANDNATRLQYALAPTIFYANEDWTDQCVVLRRVYLDGVDPSSFSNIKYARYWHGNNAVAAVALRRIDLKELRLVLFAAVWLSIAALAVATIWSGPRTRRTGLAIAVAAATVWGMPYFAPGLTQGPGDALLILALAAIVVWPRIGYSSRTIVPYCAAFGATVVFFEMMTGQLPIALSWLAALMLAIGRDEQKAHELAPPTAVYIAVIAFGLSAVATVTAKQLLAITLAEPRAAAEFFAQLRLYMGIHSSVPSIAGILLPFIQLVRWSRMLTYGRRSLGYALIAITAVGWIIAAFRGWVQRHNERGRDVLMLLAIAQIPLVWVLILPNHTYIHAPFMVRMLVVPISLVSAALWWPGAHAPR